MSQITYEEVTWRAVMEATTPDHKNGHGEMVSKIEARLPICTSRYFLVPNSNGYNNLAAFWDGMESKSGLFHSLALVHWHGVSPSGATAATRLYGGLSFGEGPAVYLNEYPLGRSPLKRIQPALAAWSEAKKDYDRKFRELAKAKLTEEQADFLAIKAGRHLLIAWSRIKDILAYYDRGPQTKWGMLEAFARASCKSPPTSKADHIYEFSGLLLGE